MIEYVYVNSINLHRTAIDLVFLDLGLASLLLLYQS